ncbi:MAG TPA: butyrate kinase [Clostridia bacterium]|nr:butyrate kinase [Clostridia bacterium]
MQFRILVVNPGSTSTKLSIFEDQTPVVTETVSHDAETIAQFGSLMDQLPMRLKIVKDFLGQHGTSLADLSAVACRGGLLRPLPSGTYRVDEEMVRDLHQPLLGAHASNLAACIGYELSRESGVPAFIVDPVVVDELTPLARLSGLKGIDRVSIFHALNQKAVARQAATDIDKPYEEANLIVAHLGGGISVGAHHLGRVVDVNNALNGDGPFAPERAGSLPAAGLVRLCFSGAYSQSEVMRLLAGKGGLVSHLGTNDARTVESMIASGDGHALLVYTAMAYTVAKTIGEMATVLRGDVDAIVITGGMARSPLLVDEITKRVEFIAPVKVYPGEDEMKALALGVLRVLDGSAPAGVYPPAETATYSRP